jgi:hypothetical protein
MRHIQPPISDVFCVPSFTAGFAGEGPETFLLVVGWRVQGVGWFSSLTSRVIDVWVLGYGWSRVGPWE